MLAKTNSAILDDLRFALDVLQESSHLGLDAEYAEKLTSVIRQQIEQGENALNRQPSVVVPARAA
jgi:hypothetical protein